MKSDLYNTNQMAHALRRATLLFFFCVSNISLFAQWQAYTPTLSDTVGIYDLRMAHGNDQVAWGIAMKYEVATDGYEWVAMDSLVFTKTSDGGETWTGGTIPMGEEPYASNICPINADTAWATGVDIDYVSYIMRTGDGGQTWQRQFEDGFSTASSYINFVHFWDAQNGIAIGDPAESDNDPEPFFEIYKTSDGGQNWTRVGSDQIPAMLPDEFGFGGNYCTFGDHIWFSTFDFVTYNWLRIFHSTDRGATWTASDAQVSAPSFADTLHGVGRAYAGPDYTLRYTVDGGETWTDLPTSPAGLISSFVIIPQSHYFLVVSRTSNTAGPFRTMISTDLGQSWMEIGDGSALACNAIFSSPTTGYAGEWQPADHSTQMFRYAGDPLTGLFSGVELEAAVNLFPNPTSDQLHIQITTTVPAEFVLLLNDAQGRLVARQRLDKTAKGDTQFDLSKLPAGVYSLTVSSEKGYLARKIVKQ